MTSTKHIVLTGLPGIGKTTIIKKTVDKLQECNVGVAGFYTEEIRNEARNRIGFDVVTLDGKRGKLARAMTCVPPNEITKFKVGQYVVYPNEFEKLVLPLFQAKERILILDEIGKMELFSNDFKKMVEDAFKSPTKVIIATIPVPKGKPIPLVEAVRTNPDSQLFMVERGNRNELLADIIEKLNVK